MPKHIFTLRAIEFARKPGVMGTDEKGQAFVKTPATLETIPANAVVEVTEDFLKALPYNAVREATKQEIALAEVNSPDGKIKSFNAAGERGVAKKAAPAEEADAGADSGEADEDQDGVADADEATRGQARRQRRRI